MNTMTAYRSEVKPLGLAPRAVNGFYCSESSPYAVREVELPNGRVGFQVGPMGQIFASHASALTFAAARREKEEARSAKVAADAALAKAKAARIEAEKVAVKVVEVEMVPALEWASSILALASVATPVQVDFARYLQSDDHLGRQVIKPVGPSIEALRTTKASPVRHRRVDFAKIRRLAVAR
jgi:hypothetical protein